MQRFHDDMHAVLGRMKAVAESQAVSMQAVLRQFASAKRLVVELSSTFAPRAIESEKHIQANLAMLGAPPAGLVEAQTNASALQAIVAKGIREEVKILQGHDAIRQRVEHLVSALSAVRQLSSEKSGQVLALERQQARAVRKSIVDTGKSIERELQAVMAATESIAAAREGEAAGSTEMERFEASIHLLESLSSELAEMLVDEAKIGDQILRHVGPIRVTLSARSEQLKELALAMRLLAFNVQVSASHMPLARGIVVLGRITSEVADEVLHCAADLSTRFLRLGEMLQAQVDAIAFEVRGVEGWCAGLAAGPSHASLLDGRRAGHQEVSRMHKDAGTLLDKTQALFQSLRFADEGEELFRELDFVLESLISCYPKCEQLVGSEQFTAGYTMQVQHDVHAMVFGGAIAVQRSVTRLTEAAPDDDLGDNVELF